MQLNQITAYIRVNRNLDQPIHKTKAPIPKTAAIPNNIGKNSVIKKKIIPKMKRPPKIILIHIKISNCFPFSLLLKYKYGRARSISDLKFDKFI